jgi:predicted acylesterase/phospholipase RssA
MNDFRGLPSNSGPLGGVRIWLSGSLPEADVASEADRAAILDFVKRFSEMVFRAGGHIIHGSASSFTPLLLDQAKVYQQRGGKKDCLVLAVSRHWSKDSQQVPVEEWRKTCTVYETPEAKGENPRDRSLDILRTWMAARCDAFVAVGGKWWQGVAGRAGVPIESNLAIERGVPCFLLGGLGGAARDYLARHPELLQSLRNGLTEEVNRSLATATDVGSLAQRVCEQLERLPLVRGNVSDGTSFRILALDGGGIKGTFTAAAIAAWEAHTKLRVADHFDLVAGTSTGGILAIGLGLGLSGQQLLDFYRQRGPIIFPVTSLVKKVRHTLRHAFQPKYSQEVLLRELESALYLGKKPIPLKQSKCRLLIPTYHAVAGMSYVFRTPHHPLLTQDADTEAAQAALATAAAPTYFSAARVGNMIAESSYFDGGVWANCPAMAAIVEAVCYLGVELDRIDVLSVGTTNEPFTVRGKIHSGWLGWNKKLLDILMNAQADTSLKHAQLLAGEPRFQRVDVTTPQGSYRLDSPAEIGELAALGKLEAEKAEILSQVASRFLNGVPASPWTASGVDSLSLKATN